MAKFSEEKLDEPPIYSDRFSTGKRQQFLRKGTAVNRSIMLNVLKAKCNKNIVDSPSSYVNHLGNTALAAAIYDQVPRALRDVIGPEEMLRMSNIFTGGTISSINLHRKVNRIIRKYHEKNNVKIEEEEGMTLKSIKRW